MNLVELDIGRPRQTSSANHINTVPEVTRAEVTEVIDVDSLESEAQKESPKRVGELEAKVVESLPEIGPKKNSSISTR
jgi:hypothetical protein